MSSLLAEYIFLISSTTIVLITIVVAGCYWKKVLDFRRKSGEIIGELNSANKDLLKRQAEEERLTKQQRILNKIINCASKSLSEDQDFTQSMKALAGELKNLFESEYCSIGKVVDNNVEDYVVSYDNYEDEHLSKIQAASVNLVRSVDLNNDNYKVCIALKSNDDISYNDDIDMTENRHYTIYAKNILISKTVKNTTIIPIRDSKDTYGYLQFINSNREINIDDIAPFKEGLLQLIQLIIRSKQRETELEQNKNLLKDTNFFMEIIEKKNNVDGLMDSIMDYLSREFNAAVISFRIPLLDGFNRMPIFYLRRCYVNPSIQKSQMLLNYYYSKRMVKTLNQMGGNGYLKCINKDDVIEDIAKDTDYYEEYNLNIKEKTLIVPIFRDYSTNECHNPQRVGLPICKMWEFPHCVNRFEKLYGVFKLRLLDDDLQLDAEESVAAVYESHKMKERKDRLQYLSKQITILFNSLVEKYENDSLLVFQKKLRESSFAKIKEFDQTCVEILKDTIHANACVIYRYDDLNKTLRRAAQSCTQDKCLKKQIPITETNNILIKVFEGMRTRYLFSFSPHGQSPLSAEPALFIPMIKKDGSCAGVIATIGRTNACQSISTAFWEHDKTHVDFIVDVLNRISESDAERLMFLQQLSHELLIPISNIVTENDLIIDTAERNKENYTKDMLLGCLKTNRDRNYLFKYIVSDVENIFSMSNKTIQYNLELCKTPKKLLLDAIRLLEMDAHASKGLSIVTNISEMPPMVLDEERIKQVFINLLKNAIRYSDKNSKIEVFYKFTDDMHEIKFVNCGIGIPIEDSETIFDLFSRSKNAQDAEPRGSGMGLYIVKTIMKAHGGDCVIRKHHQPTEISILLPNKLLGYE